MHIRWTGEVRRIDEAEASKRRRTDKAGSQGEADKKAGFAKAGSQGGLTRRVDKERHGELTRAGCDEAVDKDRQGGLG